MKKSILVIPAAVLALGAGVSFINTNKAQAANACTANDYNTLTTCVAAGGAVALTNDIVLTAPINVQNTVVLDLGGYNLTANYTTSDYMVGVKRGGDLTINGAGSITSSSLLSAVKMTIAGESAEGALAKLTVNNGTIMGKHYGINGNGSRNNTSITINGGVVKANDTQDGSGIFNPQRGDVVINGGQISGASGIEMRAGTLTVNNGLITGTANTYKTESNPNGTTTYGAGIALAQHTTQQSLSAAINGGTVEGKVAFSEANPENNPAAAIAKVGAVINGGVFHGPVVSADLKNFVKGGSFSTKPTNIPEGYEAVQNADGTWTVRKKATPAPADATKSNIKAPEDGVLGEMSTGVENGLLGAAIVMLAIAATGLIVTRIRNHKQD